MVQWYCIIISGFLVFIIESKSETSLPNVYANFYNNTSTNTSISQYNLTSYENFTSNKHNKLLNSLNTKRLSYYNYYNSNDIRNKTNNTVERKYGNLLFPLEILKTNLSKIIKSVISHSPNYTNWLRNTYYPAFESKKLNQHVSFINNTIHNKTLPTLLRIFRNANSSRNINGKHTRSHQRHQRNGERNRHRHSKRVFLNEPVNFLLPPTVTDYPELTSLEIEPLERANEEFKKLLIDDKKIDVPLNDETEQSFNNYMNYNDAKETRLENTIVNRTRVYKKKRRKQQNTHPSDILRPPIITLTSTEHIFYVTPKFKSDRLQDASNNLQVVTTPSYKSYVDNNIYYDTTQNVFSGNGTNYEIYDDYKNNLNYQIKNNTDIDTTTNWFTPINSNTNNYDHNNNNNTAAFEKFISQTVLDDNTFGLKNLSLYYSINNNNTYKSNYYLPNTTITSITTPATINYDLIYPEYKPVQNVPIHEINFMTSLNNKAYVEETTNNRAVHTPAPLLSPDVEKAGMKVYHWPDFGGNYSTPIFWQNTSFLNVNDNYKLLNFSEFLNNEQNTLLWPQHFHEEPTRDSEDDILGDSNQNTSTDGNLAAAETMYYKKPMLVTKPSRYILQQSFIDQRQVIPGAAGEDYPTLSKPPISSRFSCKNDGRRYVADVSTGCQVFIMCVGDGPGEPMLCPNGTLFSQEYLVCDWWYNVDCHS